VFLLRPMRVSLFPSLLDNKVTEAEYTWEEFAEHLGPHDFSFSKKTDVPLFSGAEYPPGATRGKAGVVGVHLGVLDFDKVSDAVVAEIEAKLEGLEGIFYTTWSHGSVQPLWCARVVVPLSRVVRPSEWPLFWERLNAFFGGHADLVCKDVSRAFFVPAAPEEEKEFALFSRFRGAHFAVDEMLQGVVPASDAQEAPNMPDVSTQASEPTYDQDSLKKTLHALSFVWGAKSNAHLKKMGRRLHKVLVGESFAKEGERDQIAFMLTSAIVRKGNLGGANPELLGEMFRKSLEVMQAETPAGALTVDAIIQKIRRHQEEALQEKEEEKAKALDKNEVHILQAFGGKRRHPYTEEELASFAEARGMKVSEWKKHWIIQKNKSFYVFFNGTYLPPYTDTDVVQAARRDLSPAISAGVDLYKTNIRGEVVLKTAADLVEDYGSVATRIEVDMTAQDSRFDDTTRTFIEASSPTRDILPEYDKEVDEWLKWLGGDSFEVLSDWIAVVTRLEDSCAALYLDGVPGSGKTLLAEGLAQIWSDRPTMIEEAMGNFNESLVRCPLVLADEALPKDYKGYTRTAELRQFIQARVRPLSRKFLPHAFLRGAIRLIITANNKNLLLTNEALSTNDIQAIVDRIIYIECPRNAVRYLQGVNTRSFVKHKRIAKHALWLAENRQITEGKRFLVSGEDFSLHRTLTTSTGLRSSVCNWLVSYLLSPRNYDSTGKKLVQRDGGKLLATSRGIAMAWTMYPTNEPAPSASRISQALAGLSMGKMKMKDGEGRDTHFWVLDPQNLIMWADSNGYATEETLRQLFHETEEEKKTLTAAGA
jgi:hypothetical protein